MNIKDVLKEKKFIIGKNLIIVAFKLNLSLEEVLLIAYFQQADTKIFDVDNINKNMGMSSEKIMDAFNKLMSKKLITFNTTKDIEGRIIEEVSLENLYESIEENIKKSEEVEDILFTTFENEFARTLSPTEYEYINKFLEVGFNSELILGALKEAVYNGATNMKYIDTILHDWKKKGYKTMEDVKNNLIKNETENTEEMFDFDWLNENE